MPITYIGKDHLAADVRIIVRAFEGALKKLAVGRTDPKALIVAEHIITFAKSGEGDPVRLCDLAVEAVGRHRSSITKRHPDQDPMREMT
jgi:hypothetical protein